MRWFIRFCRFSDLNVAFVVAVLLSIFVVPWLITCSFTSIPATSSAAAVFSDSLFPMTLRPQRISAQEFQTPLPTNHAVAMMDITALAQMTPAEFAAFPTMTALPTMTTRDILINGLFTNDGHTGLVQAAIAQLSRPETFTTVKQSYREDGAYLYLSLRFKAVDVDGVRSTYQIDAVSDLQGRLHRIHPMVREQLWPMRMKGVR